jgi:arginine deiminase
MTPVAPLVKSTFQCETGRLKRVVMKHPRDAYRSRGHVDAQWRDLGYREPPDFSRACREFDALVEVLEGAGVEVLLLPPDDTTGLDSVYARDASVVTDRGVILGGMAKDQRRGEPQAQARAFEEWGIPVLGRIEGAGRLEGGDVVWLDRSTVAVGLGYRTNEDGIRQLTALLGPEIEVVTVPSPHWRGPADVFHLMSMVSPVADDLVVVFSPTMPVPFRDFLLDRGLELVEVPMEEYDALGPNVLALAPQVCVVCTDAPETALRLEAAGAEVISFRADDLCGKGSGGPTCLTRTLEREV